MKNSQEEPEQPEGKAAVTQAETEGGGPWTVVSHSPTTFGQQSTIVSGSGLRIVSSHVQFLLRTSHKFRAGHFNREPASGSVFHIQVPTIGSFVYFN